MRRRLASLVLLAVSACTPSLTPPRESIRVQGEVSDEVQAPLVVVVHERCSPRLYLFQSCPGKFLGEAKIARPGRFLVEVDTEAESLYVVAFRGFGGQEDGCVVREVPIAAVGKPLELALEPGACPIQLPAPF